MKILSSVYFNRVARILSISAVSVMVAISNALYSIINTLHKLLKFKLIYKCESSSIGLGLSSNCSISVGQFLGIGETLISKPVDYVIINLK